MKRFTLRSLAIVITVGWYAVGHADPYLPLVGVSAADASDEKHESHPQDATDDVHQIGHAESNEADQLQPNAQHITWMRSVIHAAIALFAAAIVLGIPAMLLRGPEPPDPAETHDHH